MIKDPAHLRTPDKIVISGVNVNYSIQDCNPTPGKRRSPTKANTTGSGLSVKTQLTEASAEVLLEKKQRCKYEKHKPSEVFT